MVFRQQSIFLRQRFAAMGQPNVTADKADAAAPFQGADAKAAHHAAVFPLAQMGVHMDTGAAGQAYGLQEGVLGAVDGLAGSQHDLPHGERLRVVIERQQTLAVVQILRCCLAHLIGNGAALPAGQGVGAPGGHKPKAHQTGGLHLPVHPLLAGGRCVAVLVVYRAGAAVLNKVCHTGGAGIENHIPVDTDENLIDIIQPLHQRQPRAVNRHQIAHKGLKKMVVCINKAGIDILACSVNDLGVTGGKVAPHRFNAVAADEDVTVIEHPIRRIAGHHSIRVSNQYPFPHDGSSCGSVSRFFILRR